MTEKDIKLIIDMLIYLDVRVNWHEHSYVENDITISAGILAELQSRHGGIGNAKKRHEIISNLITKLEEQLNESNNDKH